MSAPPPVAWPDGLELGLCSNVLPGTQLDDLRSNARDTLAALRRRIRATVGETMGLGLWLAAPVAHDLDRDDAASVELAALLREQGLRVFTLNGFPYGDFHTGRVKDEVFRPAWDAPERRDYTLALGRVLARWRGEGAVGTVSTHTGGFKAWGEHPDFRRRCAAHLLEVAWAYHRLREDTGREIVLALEPEPGSTLETIPELIAFFEEHLLGAPSAKVYRGATGSQVEDVVRRHLGVCYDACHQAVEFEDPVNSIEALRTAGLRLAKFQVTSALDVASPGRADVQETLRRFAEPRYLHQVSRRDRDGDVHLHPDLETLLPSLPPPWARAQSWRIHFHVPVHRTEVAGLQTTQPDLARALRHAIRRRVTDHFEVETYTWGVLDRRGLQQDELVDGLAREMEWTHAELSAAIADAVGGGGG